MALNLLPLQGQARKTTKAKSSSCLLRSILNTRSRTQEGKVTAVRGILRLVKLISLET